MSDDDQDRYGRGAGPHRPVAGPGGARDLTAGIPAGHRNETGRTGGDYRRVLRPGAELCRTRRRGAPGCLGARRAGLRPGNVFAIMAPNSPEWLLACCGALAARGVVTGINPLCTSGEVATQLADAEARFVLTVPEF